MKEKFKHYFGYGLALTLVVIAAIAVSACSSPSTTQVPAATSAVSTTQVQPSTEVPTATSIAPTQQAQPSTPSVGGLQQRQGTMGTLSSINGNTLTLTNTQGSQVTVNVSGTTTFQKTITGTIADLQQGDVLTVTGTPDASGNIVATSISVRAAGQVSPTRSPGATFTPRGTPRTGTGGTPTFPNVGVGGGTLGTLNNINGNVLTLTSMQGNQVTVNVSNTTIIEKIVNGTVSDLQSGESLTIVGSPNANGNIIASSITILPQGQGSSTAQSTTQGQKPANTSTPIPSTALTTTYNIGIYSDALCTNPLSSLDWGNLTQGTSVTQTVYIKNIDNQTMTLTANIHTNTEAETGITFTNSGPLHIIPGNLGPSLYQLQLSLSASSTATPGDLNFNISFNGGIPISLKSHVSIISQSTVPSTITPTSTSPST